MANIKELYLDAKVIKGKIAKKYIKGHQVNENRSLGTLEKVNAKFNLKDYINDTTSELTEDFVSTNDTHTLNNVDTYNTLVDTNYVGMNYIDASDVDHFCLIGISQFDGLPLLGLPAHDTPLLLDGDFTNGKCSYINVYHTDGILMKHLSSSNTTYLNIEDTQIDMKRVVTSTTQQHLNMDNTDVTLTSTDLSTSDYCQLNVAPNDASLSHFDGTQSVYLGINSDNAIIEYIDTAANKTTIAAEDDRIRINAGTYAGANWGNITINSDGIVLQDTDAAFEAIHINQTGIGLFGVTPVGQGAALTSAVGGSASGTDAAIIDNTVTRLNELEDRIQALGAIA